MTVPSANSTSGSCPAGCTAMVGLRWWRRATPRNRREIPMSKLTDTQLVILSAASQRDDRGVELPRNLKGGAARKVVDKLSAQGCWKRAAPAARCESGGAMMTTGRWRGALPSRAWKPSVSKMRQPPTTRSRTILMVLIALARKLHPRRSETGFLERQNLPKSVQGRLRTGAGRRTRVGAVVVATIP